MLRTPLLILQIIIQISGFKHGEMRDTTKSFVVLHSDESSSEKSSLNYLKQSGKSYHYFITRNGKIFQLVDLKYSANHAGWSLYKGMMHWNEFAIGVCFANNMHQAYTIAQYNSGKLLLDSLKRRYPNLKIVTHRDIAKFRGKRDPGKNFDIGKINGKN